MRLLALCLAVFSLAALQPPDESNLPDSEKQIPMGDYCKRSDVKIGPKEVHAHPCDCTYACTVDENGNVTETGGEKTPQCKSFCSKNGRRCTCHPEEPCPAAHALMDMDHHVVSVPR